MSNTALLVHTLNVSKNDLEIVWDGVHRKIKLEEAFKGILKISKNLKISLNIHAKSLRNVCEGV